MAEEINLKINWVIMIIILKLSKQLGVEFAYPTQTLHLKHDRATTSSLTDNLSLKISKTGAMTMGEEGSKAIVSSKVSKGMKSKPIHPS